MARIVYINRNSISTSLAISRCKWRNRNFKASEPRYEDGIRTIADDERERDLFNRLNDLTPCESADKKYNLPDFDIDARFHPL